MQIFDYETKEMMFREVLETPQETNKQYDRSLYLIGDHHLS